MLSDFEECRQQALLCAQLSEKSPSPEARDEFADLARGWHSLAAKIVGDQALLDLLKEIELSGDEPLEQAPSTEAFAA
jgi:hypothetical protein